ncbi:hypothetical protein [Nodosilinea sp. E11]|uniref:hypothetical protein n=1 Tax=Nodosilinea sp. E11 TaxID=3037479 RepID=UPI002934A9B2|nr:hypothetical protein [Nodosilinea sp. E11]WOD39007.1 hypothetical protein RRF56_22640 [Nodosilinea sp. E11]
MDVIPQLSDSLLQGSFQLASPSLSVDTILRPVSLDNGESFSGYFTEVTIADASGVAGLAVANDALSPMLAQQFDQDILGDMVSIWNNFVESGQIWALLFGIVLGYMIRNLTAY